MKLLACDIGSTNLKLQVFAFETESSLLRPVGETRVLEHGQHWLNAKNPLETLSQWLSSVAEIIVQDYGNEVDSVGFSTFREALIGMSTTNQIVFAGSNLQKSPLGSLENTAIMTTFSGWVCWKLTGKCCITVGQQDAGMKYIERIGQFKPNWANLVAPGQNMQADQVSVFSIYLGGTDEQLGYLGTNLFESDGPRLVIATGTFWSASHLAVSTYKPAFRRTEGTPPFLSVDSCVLYKWGPMMLALAQEDESALSNEVVPERYFGLASSLWFSDGESCSVTRQAAVNDIRGACNMLEPMNDTHVVVYGGGVRSQYARNLIQEACGETRLIFMDGDATLIGCAMIGSKTPNVY